MRKAVIILIVLLPSCAMALESRPDFLVLRQNQRLVLIGSTQNNSYELTSSDPLFTWEGQHSKAVFASDSDGVKIEFKLDIIGPDWLFLTLMENDEGLFLTVRRTTTGGVDSDIDACCYADYAELVEDSKYGPAIMALFRRYGQNPFLPEISCLRTMCFGLEPRRDLDLETQCVELIRRLDSDRWSERDQAFRQLTQASLAPYAITVARRMKLTAEQSMALDALTQRYSVNLPDGMAGIFVSRVLSQDDVAALFE